MDILSKAKALESEGTKVIHFEVGESDFNTAEPIVSAGIKALKEGKTKYTAAEGLPALRNQISQYYANIGLNISESRIFVTSGASSGLMLLSALLFNRGDEVFLPDPGYPCNDTFLAQVGAKSTRIRLKASEQFGFSSNVLETLWSGCSKGILLASPSNPLGAVLDKMLIREIAKFVGRKDGFFILDEIYQGLVHDKGSYSSGLAVSDDLFVINSFSKFFGMTGWRLGWVVIPSDAVELFSRLSQNLIISPNSPAQYAALAAFSKEAMMIHAERAEIFSHRAKKLSAGLKELGFEIPVMPQGGFYIYVDVSKFGLSSEEFCQRLLNDYHIAVTPGTDFGTHEASRYIRFSYTTSEANIDEGLSRLARAIPFFS
jgi:aspartate/methionine/tyrosine aminotransferase